MSKPTTPEASSTPLAPPAPLLLTVQGRASFALATPEAQAPLHLLLHGAGHDHAVWADVQAGMAQQGMSCAALDLPGHGRSEGPPLPSIEALAHWVLAWLEAAEVRQPVCLIGHSMGSLVALSAAALLGSRCQALWLVGTAYPMRVSGKLLALAHDTPAEAMALVNRYSHHADLPGLAERLERNMAMMQRNEALAPSLPLLHHDLSLCKHYEAAPAAMPLVSAPSAVVLGEFDQMTPPEAAQALVDGLGAARHVLPCGHALPDEMSQALVGLLARGLPRTQAQ
ncbi:alpha/beta fold hydrolase [Roseateles sp. BYS180W]|uniref:Alpha/beta fold hydrolase n=1 Tax=Roseateles rivi TaxID=3299028 RepID=A0ABW7FZH1_9BURK